MSQGNSITTVTSKDRKCIATIERRIDFLARRVANSDRGNLDHDRREIWALQHALKIIREVKEGV